MTTRHRSTLSDLTNRAACAFLKRYLPRAKTFLPYLDSGLTPWYDIFPLSLPDEPIPTALTEAHEAGGPTNPVYYDLNGRISTVPHDGVNIIVTRHGNSTTVTKVTR